MGWEWLLDVLYITLRKHLDHIERVLRRPRGVGIHAQKLVGRRITNRADDLLIVVGAELNLENRVRLGLGDFAAQLTLAADADRKARQRR